MTKLELTKDALLSFEPCNEALEFLGKHKSLRTAWLECDNPQWMLWALSKFQLLDERIARQFAVDCAERVLPIYETRYPNDNRPRIAIEAARRCIDDHSTEADKARTAACSAARRAARSAAESAAWNAARSAAWSAAWRAHLKWQADHLRTLFDPFKTI